jgi:putative peptidoglycan lipid II flippase
MLRSTVLLSLITLISYLISLVTQLTIAYYFGTSKELDIFILSSSVPTLIGGVISSALSFSLIPYLIKKKEQIGFDYANYVIFFIKNVIKLALFCAIVLLVGFHFFFKSLYPAMSASEHLNASWVFLLFTINFFFGVLIGFGNAYHNANKMYVIPLSINSLPYFFTIVIIYFFQNIFSILSIAIGQLLGSIIILIILYWKIPLRTKDASQSKFKIEFKDYISTLKYALVAMLCFTFFQTSDSYWAFNLGSSNLSYLSYNQRLIIAIGSLIIAGPTTLLIPGLTKLNLIEGKIDFYKKTSEIITIVFSIASLFAVIVSVFSKQLIELIFQRGAFSLYDTIAVSNLLPKMLIGMVFMLCEVVLFRIMFIDKKNEQAALVGLLCAFFYFCLSGFFSSIFGVVGIAYSYFSTWVIIFFISIFFLFWGRLNLIFNFKSLKFLTYNLISLTCVYILISYLFNLFDTGQILYEYSNVYVVIPILGVFSILLYYTLMIFLFREKMILSFYNKIRTTNF